MGLSSSKQKSVTNQSENATTTPTVPSWITEPLQGYAGRVGNFLQADPASFVAPASPLQQKAFAAADTIGSWKPMVNGAAEMAKTAGAAPSVPAQAFTWDAPKIAAPGSATAATWAAPTIGPASQAGNVTLPGVHEARAQSLLDTLGAHMDPYLNDVVTTTLADYDAKTGRDAAAMAAEAAARGAFGGSRYGIRQGEFAADSNRGRAATAAQLRSDAFRTGAQLSSQDADRRQAASSFNAGASNSRDLEQGRFDLQRLIRNADAADQIRLAQAEIAARAASEGAGARTNVSMFNAGQAHDLAERQAELEAQARAQAAATNSQTSQFNAAQSAAEANRALEAAGLIGNLGTAAAGNERADLSLGADLGEIQRLIEQARAGAPLMQLQAAGQLYGALPYGSYTGQQTSGTSSGTTTTKSRPSLFDQALAAASFIA